MDRLRSRISRFDFSNFIILAALAGSIILVGCGGGNSGGGSQQQTPTISSVSVTCTPSNILTGKTSQCSASVSGTGSYSSAVTWSADSGTITSSGAYAAPSTVPSSGKATITATSAQDTNKSGSGTVSLSSITSVSVVCSPATIPTTQTSTCAATVAGAGNYSSGVTWSVSPSSIGSITGAGVFTPTGAGTATVTAASIADQSKVGSATVMAGPTLLSVQPSAVVPGSTVTVSATGVDAQNLSNDTVAFTQSGRVFSASPSAATIQGSSTNLTRYRFPRECRRQAHLRHLDPDIGLSLTNGVSAQNSLEIQVQPPAHALSVLPNSAALGTSLPVSLSAVFTAFNSASTVSRR